MRRLFVGLLFAVLAQAAMAQSLLDISQKPWEPLAEPLRTQFIDATGLERGLSLKPEYLTIQHQPLAWSEGSRLVRVLGGWQPRSLVLYFVLRSDGALIHLDGRWAAIEALNAKVPPTLTPETIGDYVWFTGFFVRADADPFLVVETAHDRYLPDLAPENGSKARKLACRRDASTRGFLCEGTVYHAAALYAADFAITSEGIVDIPASTPLSAKLDAHVNAPIDPRGYPGFQPYP